jgi:hypothetical protein
MLERTPELLDSIDRRCGIQAWIVAVYCMVQPTKHNQRKPAMRAFTWSAKNMLKSTSVLVQIQLQRLIADTQCL